MSSMILNGKYRKEYLYDADFRNPSLGRQLLSPAECDRLKLLQAAVDRQDVFCLVLSQLHSLSGAPELLPDAARTIPLSPSSPQPTSAFHARIRGAKHRAVQPGLQSRQQSDAASEPVNVTPTAELTCPRCLESKPTLEHHGWWARGEEAYCAKCLENHGLTRAEYKESIREKEAYPVLFAKYTQHTGAKTCLQSEIYI